MTINAIYDGKVLILEKPLKLKPNTHVKVEFEIINKSEKKAKSFLHTAELLNLKGPADWSSHLDDYLYNNRKQ